MVQRSAAREPTEHAGNADAMGKLPLHLLWSSLIATFLPDVAAMQAAFSFVPFRSWMPIGGLATDGCSFITTPGEPTVPRPDGTRHPSRPHLKNGGSAEGTALRTAIPPDMEAFA